MQNLYLLFSKEDEIKVNEMKEFYEKYGKKEEVYNKYIDNILSTIAFIVVGLSIFIGYKAYIMNCEILSIIVIFFASILSTALIFIIFLSTIDLYFEHSLKKYRNKSGQNIFLFEDIRKYIKEAKEIKSIQNIFSLEKAKDITHVIIKWNFNKSNNSVNIKIKFEDNTGFLIKKEYVLYPKLVKRNTRIKDTYYDFINSCLILPEIKANKENQSAIIIKKNRELVCKTDINISKELLDKNKIKTNADKIATNIGNIPREDYKDIVAMQHGFDSYEDMVANGIYIDMEEKQND